MKKDADDAENAIISSSEKVILDFLEQDIYQDIAPTSALYTP